MLTETVLNQTAEGIVLTPDEIAEVRRSLAGRYLPRHHWSPSWTFVQAVALALRRPEMLVAGRLMEMFAGGVLIQAGTDPEEAWKRVEMALETGRRGFVIATLEAMEAGADALEKADLVRLRNLEIGVAAAVAEGWPARLQEALARDRDRQC